MSLWSFVLYGLLPVGITLLAILTVPLPSFLSNTSQCRSIRGITLKILHSLLFTNLNGTLPVAFIHLLLLLLLCVTAFLGNEVLGEYRHHAMSEQTHHHAHADVLMMQQGKLWRNQRNCYLALSTLITYWALYCVLIYQERIHRLEDLLHNTPAVSHFAGSSRSDAASGSSSSSGSTAARERRVALGVSQGSSNSSSSAVLGSGIEGQPAGGHKSERGSDSPAPGDTENDGLTENPLLRQRAAGTTPQPSAPPAGLVNKKHK